MNKPTVIAGGAMLVIGVVLVAVGAVGVLQGLTVVTTFSQPQSGEYVSAELVLSSSSGVAITSAASNGGLVPAQNLNQVTSTNIGQYAVAPHSSVAGTLTYTQLTGSYYYVAFASSQPTSKIVATPLNGGTVGSSPIVLVGLVVFIAGIVVVVIGVRRKSRQANQPREEEGQRSPGMQNPPAP